MLTRHTLALISFGALVIGCNAAHAQTYPVKPVRILTSEAGGAGDFASRLIGQGLSNTLGQQFVVENRPTNAAESVAKAPPDGYTLLLYGNTVWITPLMRKSPWDPIRDYAPIMMTVQAPNLLVVTPTLPVKNVRELIALAKRRPGELNYASSATGSSTHLAAELFNSMAHVNIVRINYKGVAPAVNDIIGGRVQLMFLAGGSVAGHIKAGKLRALAVTSATPSALYPGLATVAASGVPGYESAAQFGFFAPAATPAAVVTRLNQETGRLLAQDDYRQKFFNAGFEVIGGSPQDFAKKLQAVIAKWGKVIADAHISAD
jgi:tripartite-type tricarboxylate transporter receptor subunit TctC